MTSNYISILIADSSGNPRPYRANNFRYKHSGKVADIDGYYGPILGWRRVGCKNRLQQVLNLTWQEAEMFVQEDDGQLVLF